MAERSARADGLTERNFPKRLRASMSMLSTRLTIAMVAMVVIAAAVIEIVILQGIESTILPRARERMDAQVRLLAAELDNYVGGARADVRSFLSAAALDGIVRAHRNKGYHPDDGTAEEVWRTRFAQRLIAELKAKPAYLQFAIVGVADGGRELVRVDRFGANGAVRSVPDFELQRRGDADYMAEIMSSGRGEIYVSSIGLNREHGELEWPPSPVLRVAAPIFDADGTLFGALIINLDMRPIFSSIKASQSADESTFLVNERGDYLLHPDASREFGFEFGRSYRIQDDFPVFASLLTSNGVWKESFDGPGGRDLVAAGVRVKFSPKTGVAVAQVVPYSTIMAPVRSIGFSALLGGLAVAIGAVVLAIVLARSLTKPLRQMIEAVKAFGRDEPMAVPLSAGGEIGLLARTFERMAVDIGEKSSQLNRETEERRRIFESSLDLIMVVDRTGILIRVSPSALAILGYQPDEMVGRNAQEFIDPADLERTRMRMRQVRRGRKMQNYEVSYIHKDGRVVTLAWAGVWSDPERKYFFIGRDVTEQRFAEELFRLAVEASPSGMLMVDRSGRIMMVNSELEQLFGYRREELMGQPIEMLVPAALRDQHKKLRSEYLIKPDSRGMGKGRELNGLRKDGSEFPLEIGLNPIKIRDGMMVLGVVVDISERLRIERLKDEFVSTVSHELRTPLTSITASLALLSAGGAGTLSPNVARLVSIAHSNGQRLVRLINDILDIEKMESGKMTFALKRVNVLAIVEQVMESSKAYADENGVRLRIDPQSETGDVRADADRLAQVVTNLVSNAIKFSPRGEDVVVSVGGADGLVRISVRDRGTGIPDEFKPRIFEKFAQADAGDARKKGGTGLGLSIVKQIVLRHGGEVGFDDAPGGGTVFNVDIPRWQPGVDDAGLDDRRGNLIMLCEDDPDVAAFLSERIAKAGLIVDVAPTVNEALQQADTVNYAAVLVDLRLPDGDGIGLIQSLRNRPRYHTTPIVVISGDPASGRQDSRAGALDILDWLDKPINIERLVRTLDRSIHLNSNGFPRILHVDGDASVRTSVADAMRRSARVVSVATLDEARAAAARQPFDLAVLDVALIAGAGPEILTELHNADGDSISIILFSAQGANSAYADRVSSALAGSSNSVDRLIEVLQRRVGVPAREQGPTGPASGGNTQPSDGSKEVA